MEKEMNVQVEETVEEVVEEVKESKVKKVLTKGVDLAKKHGKKIGTGVAIGAVGLVGYALGKKSSDCDEDDYDGTDAIDVDYFEVKEESVEE